MHTITQRAPAIAVAVLSVLLLAAALVGCRKHTPAPEPTAEAVHEDEGPPPPSDDPEDDEEPLTADRGDAGQQGPPDAKPRPPTAR